MKIKKTYWLASLATLTTASAVVTPLALSSCSEKKSDVIFGEEFDKKYDVTESTLIALVEKFKNDWANYVKTRDDWSDDKKEFENTKLTQDLNQFDKSFANSKYKLSYTMKTHVIINFARKYYGLELSRDNIKVDWSDIKTIFDDACESFDYYMKSQGIDPSVREQILAKALEVYNNMMDGKIVGEDNKTYNVGLKAKYPHDKLAALVEAKAEMMSCFADVNNNIALSAASINLKKFAQSYNFYYSRTDSNAFDQLVDAGIISNDKIGTDLSEHMTKIFKIQDFLHPDRKITKFDGTKFIPGFTIVPVLHSVSTNRFTNEYAINIDWQCYKTDFLESKTPEDLKKVTAHIYKNTGMEDIKDIPDDVDVTDYFENAEIETMSYKIPLTAAKEKEALKAAYIDGANDFKYDPQHNRALGKVNIGWFSKPMQEFSGYEAFKHGRIIEDKATNDDTTHYHLSAGALIDAELEFDASDYVNEKFVDSSIYKLSDYFVSQKNSVIDLTNMEAPDKTLPKVATELLNNCIIYSDAIVKNNDFTNRTVHNTINLFYRNSPYVYRDGANIFSFEQVNTSGFKSSKVSYSWLTKQFNGVSNFVGAYLENPYEEQWKAAQEMKTSLDMFFGLATALNILCFAGSLAAVILGGSKWIFVVDFILICAIQIVETKKYILFKNDYYDVVEENYEKSNKIINSEEVQGMVNFLKTQQTELSLLRANEGGEITKTAYEDNFNEKYSKLDPEQIQAKLDLFASINKSQKMTDFLNKIATVNEDWKTYQDYMKQWEEDGSFFKTMDALSTVSAALCMLTLVWTIAVMIPKPVKSPDENALQEGVVNLQKQDETVNETIDEKILESYREPVPVGGNRCIPHENDDGSWYIEEPFLVNGKIELRKTRSGLPPEPYEPCIPEEPIEVPVETQIGQSGNEITLISKEKNASELANELKEEYYPDLPLQDELQVDMAVEKHIFKHVFKDDDMTFFDLNITKPVEGFSWAGGRDSGPCIDLFKAISDKRGFGRFQYGNFAEFFENIKAMAKDHDASELVTEEVIIAFQKEFRDKAGVISPEVDLVALLKQGPTGEARLLSEMDDGIKNLANGVRWDGSIESGPMRILNKNYFVHELLTNVFKDVHSALIYEICQTISALKIVA